MMVGLNSLIGEPEIEGFADRFGADQEQSWGQSPEEKLWN